MRRTPTTPLLMCAALLAVALLAACGSAGAGEPVAVARAAPAQAACDEEQVLQAITDSGAVAPDLDFELTYLECADGFGWATISTPDGESATVLLGVSDAGIEVLDLGTSVCTADAGIPADVAAAIAPPGVDPAGDCPTPAPPGEPQVTVSPSAAAPGETVTFSGTVPVADDCPVGDESARLTSAADLFPPDGFGPQVPRGEDGAFEVAYAVPTTTPPGEYTIGLRCGGANLGVSTTLEVTPATTPPTEPAPPSTAGPASPAPAQPTFTG